MSSTLTSPSGRILRHRATRRTTAREDAEAKTIRINREKEHRLAENRAYLENKNMQAFLKAIAEAEGGGYDFKYGAVKGKKDDPWRFTDYSTHPGPGVGGRTTAAGMYQENVDTWREMGSNMGLSDFTPETQDLIAVEILRVLKVADNVTSGDLNAALDEASHRWSALPQGKDKAGRYPKQPSVSFDKFEADYKRFGGISK